MLLMIQTEQYELCKAKSFSVYEYKDAWVYYFAVK